MGAVGLPGDLSSMSRFVRCAYVKSNSVFGEKKEQNINQFFHILYSVHQQKGCVKTEEGFEITQYCCCCDVNSGVYYYTTYDNFKINAIDMHKENLNSQELIIYDFVEKENINIIN